MSPDPWLPRWLVRLVPEHHREEWLGDLLEAWRAEGHDTGPWDTARLWLRVATSALEARWVERRLNTDDPSGRGGMGSGWMQDLRLAWRMLRREPAASGAAFSTLALGVWAFLVGFALVDGALLQPLGYEAEDRLAVVGHEGALYGISMPNHVDLVEESALFEASAVWQGWGVLLRPDDGPWTMISGASVTSDYLHMVGASATLGRLFGPEDDAPGHAPTVLLSHASWVSRYGGSPDVLGTTIEHEGIGYTVIGVVEQGFRDPMQRLFGRSRVEIWRSTPPIFHGWRTDRGQVSFWSLARLRAGVDAQAASMAVRARSAEILGASPSEIDIDVFAYADILGRESRGSLLLLLVAGFAVLVVSAANLVNLLLARGTGRLQEMAIRSALGAGRMRLVRQLLVEGAVLGVLAAALGCVLTALTLDPVARLSASLLPSDTVVRVGPTVLAVAVAVAIAAAVAAALLPSLGATRRVHMSALRQGRGAGARRSLLQTALVVTQTAMAVVLVTASGLLLRTLWQLGDTEIGFDADAVTATYVTLHRQMFADLSDQTATLERLEARFAALLGVAGVASITDLPMNGRVNSTRISRPDLSEGADERHLQTLVRAITPDYFAVMGIAPVRGRVLTADDRPGSTEVAVVNRTYAERHFPGLDPLGRTVFVRGVERTIVGIVEDATQFSVGAPRDPVLYLTYHQEVQSWMRAAVYVALRAEGEPPTLAALREAAAEVDPRLPLGNTFRLRAYVDRDTAGHRLRALLATSFGALALALASVGLAGVTAYLVGRRTRELGVRVALGAGPRRVAALVLRGSGTVTALGIGLGLLAAIPAGRVLSGFLYRVPALDPATLVVAALTLGLASLLASAVPTLRALRIAPVDALRED